LNAERDEQRRGERSAPTYDPASRGKLARLSDSVRVTALARGLQRSRRGANQEKNDVQFTTHVAARPVGRFIHVALAAQPGLARRAGATAPESELVWA
jgi:hypothetical protein